MKNKLKRKVILFALFSIISISLLTLKTFATEVIGGVDGNNSVNGSSNYSWTSNTNITSIWAEACFDYNSNLNKKSPTTFKYASVTAYGPGIFAYGNHGYYWDGYWYTFRR